ncbi:hypothetical protein LCGC14_1537740 [marine sediment metagenome]|uniref:Uncharacterized protein n=1 Tax=marine sediment metagenome TaxID=412755 RepID=A0A0F9LUT6_9ZZZZ
MPNIAIGSKIERPVVRLVGSVYSKSDLRPFNSNVDHTKIVERVGSVLARNRVSSATELHEDNLLVFYKEVRVIITLYSDYPVKRYLNESRKLGPLEFEGKTPIQGNIMGLFAETYYTLNGKDPKRTKSYLYKYRDYNNYTSSTKEHRIHANPSFDSTIFSSNINELGFRLRRNYAGEDNIILKAKTYYRGKASDITIVKFRIYNPDIEDVNDRKM